MDLTLRIALFVQVFLLAVPCAFAQQRPITLADELNTLLDVSTLPSYKTHTISAQTSSYDTTGGNNDGFSGKYSFISRNPDSSLVIFDMAGPGVLNRIWTPTPTEDTLDFYVDDLQHPVLSICYMDLFSGKVFPFVQPLCGNQLGGYYCYFPILFEKHCRIVSRGKKMFFHQLQYRLYEKGTQVRSFTPALNEQEKEKLTKIGSFWNRNAKDIADFIPRPAAVQQVKSTVNLKPGSSQRICRIDKPGRIAGIEIGPAGVFEGFYKHIDIRISWDDEQLPAVYCPVADFFGYAFGKQAINGLLLGSHDNRNYCYFPMPFDKNATIELLYRDDATRNLQPVQINSTVYYTSEGRNKTREGKLYTSWNHQQTGNHEPHYFLKRKGKGHYVGTVLQAQGLKTGMTEFFEGDDSTVIDGELRLHGTGSEDYFNGGWYALLDRWDTRMSLPLHGALDYSLLFSRTGGYRFYLSDKLSFEKEINHSIEYGPQGNNFPAVYTSLAFYYCDSPVREITKPDASNTLVYIPDTLNVYPQFTGIYLGDNLQVHTVKRKGTIGQTFELEVKDESKLKLSLDEVPPGRYRLFVDYDLSGNGAVFSVWQRQTRLCEDISAKGTSEGSEEKYLATFDITSLNNAITFRFDASNGNMFLLKKVMLVKAEE